MCVAIWACSFLVFTALIITAYIFYLTHHRQDTAKHNLDKDDDADL